MDAIAFRTRARTNTQPREANCTRRAGVNTTCSGRKARKRIRRSLPSRCRGWRDKDGSINHASDEPYDTDYEEVSGHQPLPLLHDPLGPASSSSDVVIVDEVEGNDQDAVTSSQPKRQRLGADSRFAGKGPTGSPASAPVDSSDGLDDDEELRIVGVVGQVVTRDLPHPRPDCAEHRFNPGCAESNKKYCNQCYCYVCDCKASECEFWGTGQRERDHSNARPHEFWDRLRLAARTGDQVKIRAEFKATGPLSLIAPCGASAPGGRLPQSPAGSVLAAGRLLLPPLPLAQLSQRRPQGGGAGASGSGVGTGGESMEADLDMFLAALGRLRASVAQTHGSGGGVGGGGGGIGTGDGGYGMRALAGTSGGGGGGRSGSLQPVAAGSSTAVQQQRAPQSGPAVANAGRSEAAPATLWGMGLPPQSLTPLYPCYNYMGQYYLPQPPQPWQTQQPAVQPQQQLQPPSLLPRSQLQQLVLQQPQQLPNWQSQQQAQWPPPPPPHPCTGQPPQPFPPSQPLNWDALQQVQQQPPQQQQTHPSAVHLQLQPPHPPPPPACSLPSPSQVPYRYGDAQQSAQQLHPPTAPYHLLQSPQQSGQVAGSYCQWHPLPPWQPVVAPLMPAARAAGSLSAESQGHTSWRPASAPVSQPLAGGGGGGGGSATHSAGALPTVFSMRTLTPP